MQRQEAVEPSKFALPFAALYLWYVGCEGASAAVTGTWQKHGHGEFD